MRRKRSSPSGFLRVAALIAATLFAGTAGALPARLRESSPDYAALYNAGLYRHAAEALQVSILQNPEDASLQYWLGRCYFEMRDFSRSISSLERAIALDPDRSEYHDWLGRACGRKAEANSHSDMVSALSLARRTHREFEVAVQLDGTNLKAQRDLISFLVSAPRNIGGGEERAQAQIRALSVVDPIEGELALADLFAERKKFEQASEEYQKVIESWPNRISAFLEVADYYRGRGDSERMEQAVEAGAKIAPSDRRLSYYRGVALVLGNKDSAVAEKDLRTYLDTVPDNSELPAHSSALEWLGKLYENEGKPELAAEHYRAALALDPRNRALREALKRLQKSSASSRGSF